MRRRSRRRVQRRVVRNRERKKKKIAIEEPKYTSKKYTVFLRLRDDVTESEEDKETQGLFCRKEAENQVTLVGKDGKNPRKYLFTHVFGPSSSQEEVFGSAARNTVDEFINGKDCLIPVYGHLCTGLSFTMNGGDSEDKNPGIVHRSIKHVFQHVSCVEDQCSLTISYFVIVMERIRDLIDFKNKHLSFHGNKKVGISIRDLTEVPVASEEEAMKIYETANENFQKIPNPRRMFCREIFVMNLERKESKKKSRIWFAKIPVYRRPRGPRISVDLDPFREVVRSVIKRKNFVPFRNSKLTRIIEEFFDEESDSKVTFILTAVNHVRQDNGTYTILRFGNDIWKVNPVPLSRLLRMKYFEESESKNDLRDRVDFLLNEFGWDETDKFYPYSFFLQLVFTKNGLKVGSVPKVLFFEEL